jgi:hypothetical protein
LPPSPVGHEQLKVVEPGVVVSDRGANVVDKAALAFVSNGRSSDRVGSLVKGEAFAAIGK